MDSTALIAIIVPIAIVFAYIAFKILAYQNKIAAMSPDELDEYFAGKQTQIGEQKLLMKWGTVNPAMLCPHCHTKGLIRTKAVTQKKGISGGKATAALITGGFSVLATGLSRKEGATQAHCCHCNNTWFF